MTSPARPPFDPELGAALTVVNENVPATITPEMVPVLKEAAAQEAAASVPDDLTLEGAFSEEAHEAPGPEGAPAVPLIVWRPTGSPSPTGVLYWIHGGGMMLGTHRGREISGLLEAARELGAALVSVDYRLAPENPHPAPVEDCYAGLVWVVENAEKLGIDPERVVVGGASAGGGLAAATALLARDRGGPRLIGQLLLYPMLDDRNDSVSAHQMVGVGVWDRVSNATGWGALLGDAAGGPDVSFHAAPARAEDLSGLPPAFLDVGSAETFRDEVVEYASRIWKAGGVAELHVWPGAFHGFDTFAPQAAISRSAAAQRLPWLRRTMGA
ncbi:alpha/beta hydrolase [Nocardiopsis sp. NPDC050513]|uniref:alpha/beta hydrolase n=1 Tax=Nocardiopsis sp. NPDC050513 TaxID=3364338 RepID=UPI0037B99721